MRYSDDELLEKLEWFENSVGKVTQSAVSSHDNMPSPSTYSNHFGSFSNAKLQADIDDIGQIHLSNDELANINNSISDREEEIITGLLLGDANLKYEEDKSSGIQIEMVNKEFLEHLDDKLGDITTGVRKSRTAQKLYEKNKQSYEGEVKRERYNDMYVLRSRRLPFFDKFKSWYSGEQKRFPDNLKLTPTVLKYWYCCDGSLMWQDKKRASAVIYTSNENDRQQYLEALFDGLSVSPSAHSGGGGCIQFTRDETNTFLEYIGQPVVGYEYKWESDNYDEYQKLK